MGKLGTFIGGLLFVAAAVLAVSYPLMLLVGGVHHSLAAQVPALGYGQTVLAVIVVDVVIVFLRKIFK